MAANLGCHDQVLGLLLFRPQLMVQPHSSFRLLAHCWLPGLMQILLSLHSRHTMASHWCSGQSGTSLAGPLGRPTQCRIQGPSSVVALPRRMMHGCSDSSVVSSSSSGGVTRPPLRPGFVSFGPNACGCAASAATCPHSASIPGASIAVCVWGRLKMTRQQQMWGGPAGAALLPARHPSLTQDTGVDLCSATQLKRFGEAVFRCACTVFFLL